MRGSSESPLFRSRFICYRFAICLTLISLQGDEAIISLFLQIPWQVLVLCGFKIALQCSLCLTSKVN